jgi:hypothetical protein
VSNGITGIATGTIDALKGTPILVVMVVLNAAFLGAGSFYLSKQQDDIAQLTDKVLDRCLPNVHMEAYIVTPPQRRSPVVDVFGQQRE